MSSVFPLFQDTGIPGAANAESQVAIAVTNIMASNLQLVQLIKEVPKQLDAVERVAEKVEDQDTRKSIVRMLDITRQDLTLRTAELSQELKKMVELRGELMTAKPPAAVSQ